MFTFLNSILLFALPAALVPLLIYLFNRQKLSIIPYSTLRFLRQMQQQRMRKVKLYHWLLLIIRTLIILLAVLAFARPALKGVFTAGLGAHAASTVVVMLDNSLSMQADTREGVRFDLAKARAKEALALLQPEDNAHLVVFSDKVTFVNEEPTHNATWLAQVVDRTPVTYRSTDLAGALKAAFALVEKSPDLNREIYLVSDLAKSGWQSTGSDSLVMSRRKSVALYLCRPAADRTPENSAVIDVRLDNQIITAGQPFRVRGRVANYTDAAQDNVPLELMVNDQRVNETAIALAPHTEQTAVLPALAGAPGWYTGAMVLGDDALAADNRRFFAFAVPQSIPVLVVGEQDVNSGGVKYLRYALAPAESSRTPVVPTVITHRELARYRPEDFRVVVAVNVALFSDMEARQLRLYCEAGGQLMVFLGDRADLRAYNSFFQSLKVGQAAGMRGSLGQKESFVTFGSFATEHPVFKDFFTAANLINGPRVYAYCQMVSPASAERLVRFSNGDPAILEAACGKGRVVICPFDVDPTASNLAFKASFVPLVARLVQYLATDLAGEGNSVLVGGTYRHQMDPGWEQGNLACRTPRGEVYTVARPSGGQGTQVEFSETEMPGIYTLTGNGKMLAAFAVNSDGREADLTALTPEEVTARTPGTAIRPVGSGTALATVARENRYGREMFGTALWLVAALLVLEMAVAWRRRYVKDDASGKEQITTKHTNYTNK